MKKSVCFPLLSVFVFVFQIVLFSGLNAQVIQADNPLVGTWRSLSYIDSTGTEIKDTEDEIGYTTLLENGTFIRLGFTRNFPKTGKQPLTNKECQKILKNSWEQIGTYTIDMENKMVSLKYLFDTNPANIGHTVTVNFEVKGDIVTHWINVENTKRWIHKYIRVK